MSAINPPLRVIAALDTAQADRAKTLAAA